MAEIIEGKEMQIKTRYHFHLTPVRMAVTKKTSTNKCWRGCREKEPLYTLLVGM